jgi:hypothetical protein
MPLICLLFKKEQKSLDRPPQMFGYGLSCLRHGLRPPVFHETSSQKGDDLMRRLGGRGDFESRRSAESVSQFSLAKPPHQHFVRDLRQRNGLLVVPIDREFDRIFNASQSKPS